MPPDLLADHVVKVGGAVLRAGQRVAGVVGSALVGVGRGAFRLLVDAFGLLAGLPGGFIDRLAAFFHRGLEIRIRHCVLRKGGSWGKLVRNERVASSPWLPC